MFAKMGLAMPDGSFYIRNGPVGASDLQNAIKAVGRGEQDGSSGDPIRVHIMKRAKALGLSAKIPDTWNPDGSLKHDWTSDVEDFLAHYGVQGMHWRSTAQREAAAATATAKGQKGVQAAKKANANKKATKHDLHLLHLAHLLKLSKAVHAAHEAHVAHLKKTGQTAKIPAANKAHTAKQAALAKLASNAAKLNVKHSDFLGDVEDLLEHFGVKGMHWGVRHTREELEGQAVKLRAKVATLDHDAFDGEFVEHFGVKGMRWGVERSRTARTDDDSKSADAARARATADKIKKHGVSAVSNADLQHLVSRQNLEKQHAGLSVAQQSDGRKFLDKLVSDQKDAAQKEASKVVAEYAAKGAVWLAKEGTKQLLGTKSGAGKHAS